MQCELCGKDYFECRLGVVDGVRMMLCPSCMKYGQGVKETAVKTPPVVQRSIGLIKKPREKDVYADMTKELVSGWNNLIKNAREKKGLSREELGFRIGERTVTIAKIENGDLRPSDSTIVKLEKELGITLLEEVKQVSTGASGSRHALTLGDFFKAKKK
ncbi:MAG: multiprotein bridging factor aMBF1 [Candidatus Thermoplasmatota archaeon]|jgi:putative transcription factor|nr:multiprotein bridging factor aMBF1 [Candidatus Thermoplasmatota archaeon]